MSVRFSEIVKPYRGEGGQDVETWLKKVELVAKLQKVDDLATFLPLFLDGLAFAVYEQFSDKEKNEYSLLRAGLVGALATSRFSAYDQLRNHRLQQGETVYVFLSDLRRLSSLARIKDANGWLIPYDESLHCQVTHLIPLMAVVQHNKGSKVRPVMDFRSVNDHIQTFTANSDVCCETIRDWRRLGENVALLDLRKAYLQLHVSDDLFRHQAVQINGRTYCLTRLAFGLNVAPKIMTAVLSTVLSMDPVIAKGTDSYIDDVIVNLDVTSVEQVRAHLLKYGLVTKEPELIDGARVLGLKLSKTESGLVWSRDNELPPTSVDHALTRRELYSLLGRLVAHYPVGGWLRVACSYLKRQCNATAWDCAIDEMVMMTLRD